MSDINFDQIVGDYNDRLSTVLPRAVGSNLLLWSSVSVATIILFNILRPRNKIIYEPKVKYHVGDKQPPKIDDGFFSWVSPLIRTKEDVLMDKVGLDAVTFLRFLRMMRWIFLFVAILTCAILIPINVTYNFKNVDPKKRNTLSILTVQDVQGPILFAHVAISYAINALILGYVWWNWKAMIKLRTQWFRSDEYNKSFYARTLMVLNVPKNIRSDDGLRSLLGSLQMPYPTTSVHIGRQVGQLPELIEYHNDTVRSFEKVLVRYLKGGKIGSKRPTIRIGGFMGFGGEKKDAIDFYTRKLARTEAAVMDWREKADSNRIENYGFASLAAVPYAHIVAQRMAGKHPKGTTITLAPNPKDIIWKNLTMTDAVRARQKMIGWLWLGLICFINTIPLLFISLVANLGHVATFIKPIGKWQKDSEWSFALVNGILPPTISAIFGFFLPKIMRWLSRYQGAITHSRLDRAVVARYFAFLIISQLFIFSLLGVIFNLAKDVVLRINNHDSIGSIVKNLHNLPHDVQSTYINQAPYWLTFFPLRGFLAVFDLAQLVNVVWIWFKTRIFGRTPRDIREWTQPPSFEYEVYYSNLLFMAAVGLVYAPLAPLVALAAAVVFWMSSIVYKYQIMFVFVSKVESGGRLWNVVINRLLTSAILMQLLMTLTIGLTHGWNTYFWTACLPPVLIVLLCKVWWAKAFMNKFRYYIPSDQEIAQTIVHSERSDNKGNRLEKRFGHPALVADLFTPMLHSKMMPLLGEVYHGRLATQSATLEEYGGQKYEAKIAPGGIKIAGIEQSDLDYDPALYQRDRGEMDADSKSISGTTIMSSTIGHTKSTRTLPAGYGDYLEQGPQRTSAPMDRLGAQNFELSQLNNRSDANLPLLAARSNHSFHNSSTGHDPTASQYSLHDRTPSTGLGDTYGQPLRNADNNAGYFSSPSRQYNASPAPSHARGPSAGLDSMGGAGGAYPPRPNAAYPDQQYRPHQAQRQPSESSMGYYQQGGPMGGGGQGPAPRMGSSTSGYSTPPSRYYTPSPTMGNDVNNAGRGAYNRQNF